jgi:hypothetical protein
MMWPNIGQIERNQKSDKKTTLMEYDTMPEIICESCAVVVVPS